MPTILHRHIGALPIQEKKPKPPWRQGRTFICDYRYERPDGSLVFLKKRWALDQEVWGRTKDFQIQTPLPGQPNLLRLGGPSDIADWVYRLPLLQEPLTRASEVHWCEGEKDADALWDYGYPATSNAMGAAKAATAAQARWLSRAGHVFIWADKDSVIGGNAALGYWNAATRYNALIEIGYPADQISIVKARHKGDKDAADHVARYGSRRDPITISTHRLVALAKPYRPGTAWKSGY